MCPSLKVDFWFPPLFVLCSIQVNVNLAGLPALVLPCGFVRDGSSNLPVGLQMIGAAFDEVLLHSMLLLSHC